jgi:hypothetical protein
MATSPRPPLQAGQIRLVLKPDRSAENFAAPDRGVEIPFGTRDGVRVAAWFVYRAAGHSAGAPKWRPEPSVWLCSRPRLTALQETFFEKPITRSTP